jgi:uncharacterized membrane protein YqaE (UPF0057 family)
MGAGRILACIIFPPLAVIDKGIGAFLLTTFCTFAGVWIGGILVAILICLQPKK